MKARSENSWGKGKEQGGSIAIVISVNVSVEKIKVSKSHKEYAKASVCWNSIQNQSRPVNFVQMWTAVGFRAFRLMPKDVYSYDSSWYKNMQRHAQTGTSLQL